MEVLIFDAKRELCDYIMARLEECGFEVSYYNRINYLMGDLDKADGEKNPIIFVSTAANQPIILNEALNLTRMGYKIMFITFRMAQTELLRYLHKSLFDYKESSENAIEAIVKFCSE